MNVYEVKAGIVSLQCSEMSFSQLGAIEIYLLLPFIFLYLVVPTRTHIAINLTTDIVSATASTLSAKAFSVHVPVYSLGLTSYNSRRPRSAEILCTF